jgi:hypothetical protein
MSVLVSDRPTALAFLAAWVLLRIYLPADAATEFVISPIPDGRVLAFVVGAMLLTSLVARRDRLF